MSSDYYGGIAGELADQGADLERSWLEWLDAYTRREPAETYGEDLRAAFCAGYGRGRLRGQHDCNPVTSGKDLASTERRTLPSH